MQLTIIIWTLICAIAIIAYPIFLSNKKTNSKAYSKRKNENLGLESLMLFSFDLKNRPLGWSFTLEIPELTENILMEDIIYFYLETEETCLKLPVHNEARGYTANVFKNVGKVYLTFKCIKDGVSNYSAPMCHLKSLKVLIIKSENLNPKNGSINNGVRHSLHNILRASGINIHNYEQTLEYLSNFCQIDFKGYRKNCISSTILENKSSTNLPEQKPQYSTLSM